MYEVVEEIGLLQRKMLESKENLPPQKNRTRNMSIVEPRISLPAKRSCFINESTILGTSYNYHN